MDRRITAVSLILVSLFVGVLVFQSGVNYEHVNYERDVALGLEVSTGYSMHINIYVQRAGSDEIELIKDGVALNNAGQITTIGLNWIEDQLGDSPSTDPAQWISLSLDSGSPAAGWTQIPTEIAAGGLTRAAASYTSTGDGVWTITYQWTATAQQVDVQLTGLQYVSTGDNNLLCADTFTPTTLEIDDKLTVTWTITVT